MRIAMLTNNYKPFIGGVPISIERLSEGLRSLGHEVFIFAPSYENQEEDPYVIRYKSIKRKQNEMRIPNIIDYDIEKAFKKLDIDLIHVHHPMFIGWTAKYLGNKYHIPVIYTYHTRYEQYLHHVGIFGSMECLCQKRSSGLVKKTSQKVLEYTKSSIIPNYTRMFINGCDHIIVPTPMMKEILFEMGVKKTIDLLPTGLSESFFIESKEEVEEIRQRYIGDKKYLFCTVSRLAKEKNVTFIIEGIRKLKEKVGAHFRLLIIGDGPMRQELEQQVSVLGLEEEVVFLKSIPNDQIKSYYSACDLFLFASKSETQGIVLLEAMAGKTPVIAVKASGVIDVVVNGENGYMTLEDLEEWTCQIQYLMKHKEGLEKLKQGAYQTAMTYRSRQIAQRAETYYRKVREDYDHMGYKIKDSKQTYKERYING